VRSVRLLGQHKSGRNKRNDTNQLLKILTVVIGHTTDVLNFDSTKTYIIIALIVNFK